MQNRGQLFWGIALVTAGLLFFGQRMGWFDFDLNVIRNLWPILLILAGVNLIFVRRNQQAALATTILLGIAVPLFVFSAVGHRGNWGNWRNNHRFDYRNNDRDNDSDNADSDNDDDNNNDDEDTDSAYDKERSDRTKTESQTAFVEAMNPATRTATLNLVGGAGRFSIGEPVTELIKADAKQTGASYKMDVDRDADTQNATINLKPSDGEKDSDGDVNINLGDDNGDFDNRLDVRLNDKPIWTVNATVGAGKGTFDLSRYVVRNLKLEAGAADVELTLGGKATQSDVKISAGVASITVRVPKNVGVKVKREGAMNVNTLDGFTDAGGNTSISPDYEKTANKINIDFEGGISTFKVVRY
jgi:hypothetical protein